MNVSSLRRLCGVAVALLFGAVGLAAAQQTGTITGTVTDQNTGSPVAAARVTVAATNISAVTTTEGRFTLRAVPVGTHEVRVAIIGYASAVQTGTVGAGETATLDFALRPAAISLDVLTVTATGEAARARELGHTVAQIKADDVTRVAPVSDFADLLQGRAANVQVMPSSGTTGTGAKVRIRGLASLSLSNEPVYYVDGIRIESGSNSLSVGTGGQSISRINDINPEEIESIEVIKGPSAATLYGTQAANGVIRITTKKGVAGRPSWRVYSEIGVLNDNNEYPTNFRAWDGGSQCILTSVAAGSCSIDSITSFNPLMNEDYTFLGTGWRGQVGAQVSGGTEQTRYFFSAEYEDEIGHYRTPDQDYSRIVAERQVSELPYEHFRPNEVKKISVRSNVNANLGTSADVAANIGLVRSDGRLPQNDNNVTGMLPSGYFGKAVAGSEWGFFRPGEVFSILTEQEITRFTGSSNANWRPTEWLTTRATVGLDYTNRLDLQFQGLNEGPNFSTFRRGRRTDNRFEIAQTTVDLGATANFVVNPEITSKTSVGVQYLRDWFFGVQANGSEFAPGGKTVDAGALRSAGETTTETITLGAYVDQLFGWRDRLFLDVGLRVDNNSTFGASFRSAAYPKVQGSWVISEEQFFPTSLPFSSLRLRAAYGQSGVQPGSTDALRFYGGVTASLAGTDVPGLVPSAFGNDSLKPERSAEIELGFDADFFEGRTHLEFTYYNKKTREALVQRTLPGSLGGPGARFENIGSVRNRGVEGVLTTSFNVTPSATVDLTLSGSRNINELLTLKSFPNIGTFQRQAVGYPLFGYWDRVIKSFNDANGNGIIEASELVVSDTSEFIGSSIPRTELALNGGVSLFNNRVRLSGQLDYRGDFKQFNLTEYFRCTSTAANNCRAINDPTASLQDQANAVAARSPSFNNTQGPYVEDADFLKLRELSLTYHAPESFARVLRANSVSFTLTGRNLATITGYDGVDPEINQNGQSDFVRDFLTQPPITQWVLRVNLGF